MKPSKKQAQGLLVAWLASGTPAAQKAARALGFITLIGIVTFIIALSCASAATGQETTKDLDGCWNAPMTKECMEYMEQIDAEDTGKKYWTTPTPNNPTYKRTTDVASAADRRLAGQVSATRESYEKSLLAFALLVDNGGAGHWSADVRINTWSFGGIMVNNYEKWERAVNKERDFRESAGLDNSQYDRNIRNLKKAKQVYSRIMATARDQAEAAGYDAP